MIESGRVVYTVSDGWEGMKNEGPYDAIHVGKFVCTTYTTSDSLLIFLLSLPIPRYLSPSITIVLSFLTLSFPPTPCLTHTPYTHVPTGAAADVIPDELVKQLKVGGAMFIPVGEQISQTIKLVKKVGGQSNHSNLHPVNTNNQTTLSCTLTYTLSTPITV